LIKLIDTIVTTAERKVGYLDVKSSPIHFHVQRSTTFTEENKVIRPYEIELLNQGEAMNLTSGVFKAPVDGIYHFSFRGTLHPKRMMDLNYLHLRKNDKIVSTSISASTWHTASLVIIGDGFIIDLKYTVLRTRNR